MSSDSLALPLRRSTHQAPSTTRTPAMPSLGPVVRAVRVLLAVALIAASVAAVAFNDVFRAFEAQVATWALSPVVGDQVDAARDVYFVWTSSDTLVGLQVTAECTVLILGVPLTVFAAVLLATTRIRTLRVLPAIGAMWIIVIAVNAIRLAVIGWATQTWGIDPGYTISHTLIGSIIGIAGFVAGFAVLFLIMGIKRRSRTV